MSPLLPSFRTLRSLRLKTFLLCALCALPALARTHDPVHDDVVALPEFNVSAGHETDDYIAVEATTGTRLGEDINKLPFNVEVITAEMMEDFQLDDIEDLMEFMGGAGGDPGDPDGGDLAAGSYGGRVRGFTPLTVRDGFQYAMPATFANTASVEFIRGPQSVFYGRAEPGGIINRISARPSYRPHYRLSATYGAPHDFLRLTASASGPVLKNKLFYRAWFSYAKRNGGDGTGPVDFASSDTAHAGLSFLLKFSPDTTLHLSAEYQLSHSIPASRFTAVYDATNSVLLPRTDSGGNPIDPELVVKATRGYSGLGEFNAAYANNAFRDTDYYGLGLLFNHRLSKNLEHRSALQTYNREVRQLRWSGAGNLFLWEPTYDPSLAGDPNHPLFYNNTSAFADSAHHTADNLYNTFAFNGTFSNRNPYHTSVDEQCLAFQSDLKASFKRSRSSHILLLAADASFRERDTLIHNYSSAFGGPPLNSADRALHLAADGTLSASYSSSVLPDYDAHPEWFGATTDQKLSQLTAGGFASYRGVFLRNRLHVMAGLRLEHYSDSLEDRRNSTYTPPVLPPSPGGSPLPSVTNTNPESRGTKPTYSAGATYQIAGERVAFYLNTSSSYRPKMEVDRGFNTLLPPQEAQSVEAGVKGVLKKGDSVIGYTLSLYDMTLENIAIANDSYLEGVDDGLYETPQYLIAGEQKSRGFDLRLTYIPLPRLVASISLGHCDNKVTKVDANGNSFVSGRPTAMVPAWSASFFTRYAFGGSLRGLRVGLAGAWRERVTAYYETSGAWGLESPSALTFRGFVTYRFLENRRKNTHHEISLNISNLLDADRLTRTGRPYYGRLYRLSYTARL